MNKKAINTVEKYNMLSKGDRVLVAVSGGADSMALLEFFISIKDKYDLNLCAAHMEHGIRGGESLSDALFVKKYCEKSGVKLYMKSINAPYLAKKAGMGVEEYSRQARYDFFSTIPCDKIATAHNLTDNVETLLFRLARGTGLKGACAIPPVRDKIIRPFIEISSDEIRAWCNDNNIAYRIDSTNKDDTYSRNLIRLQMLPLFQRLNNGYLEKWAREGVMLLNTVLTVRAHQANSHRGIGWEQFTDAAIRILDQEDRPIVFLLWGRPAQMKASMLHNPKHLILEAPHPSPLSAYRGFFGCKHFSKANEFLKANGVEPVDWQIENI